MTDPSSTAFTLSGSGSTQISPLFLNLHESLDMTTAENSSTGPETSICALTHTQHVLPDVHLANTKTPDTPDGSDPDDAFSPSQCCGASSPSAALLFSSPSASKDLANQSLLTPPPSGKICREDPFKDFEVAQEKSEAQLDGRQLGSPNASLCRVQAPSCPTKPPSTAAVLSAVDMMYQRCSDRKRKAPSRFGETEQVIGAEPLRIQAKKPRMTRKASRSTMESAAVAKPKDDTRTIPQPKPQDTRREKSKATVARSRSEIGNTIIAVRGQQSELPVAQPPTRVRTINRAPPVGLRRRGKEKSLGIQNRAPSTSTSSLSPIRSTATESSHDGSSMSSLPWENNIVVSTPTDTKVTGAVVRGNLSHQLRTRARSPDNSVVIDDADHYELGPVCIEDATVMPKSRDRSDIHDDILSQEGQDEVKSRLVKLKLGSSLASQVLSVDKRERLMQLSRNIMKKTSINEKSLPRDKPLILADNRQALCETALYYQAWQGACYINKGVLYSFMFDNNGHSRDLLDGDVVIARAGGGMVRDKATKQMVQSRDQKDNSQSHAVRAAIVNQNPIVIFCGSENSDAPTRMPHRYCGLDWYKVTHVWSEKTFNTKGEAMENIKYRFEKLDTSVPGWWTPVDYSTAVAVGSLNPPAERCCKVCKSTSQQVYLESWMCLNASCDLFWKMADGSTPNDALLNYDPRFLKQKTFWHNETAPYDIRPSLPDPSSLMGEDVSYVMTRGICCPECGKCTSRTKWKGWECSNSTCKFIYIPQHTLVTARSIQDPWHPVSNGFAPSHDWCDSSRVKVSVELSQNYRFVQYKIDGIEGCITRMIANRIVTGETKGPDEMFEALQTLDAGLERRSFSVGKEGYMTAFSGNWGMPYKFVASVQSAPFNGAPWPITETRTRLNWAARTVVGGGFPKEAEFNELLTFGYFDGQNVKYHDDGEEGLGEPVASLSLGNAADMWFRVKAKHFTGVSNSGVFTDKTPLPGTMLYTERKLAFEGLQKENLHGMERRTMLRAMAEELKLKQAATDRKPWIRLRLSHGDIVIMHGQAIQEYMEHQVDPLGSLRFALTCRTILADHLGPSELPAYEVCADDGHYDGSGIADVRP